MYVHVCLLVLGIYTCTLYIVYTCICMHLSQLYFLSLYTFVHVRAYSFVRVYKESNIGALPVSSSGKLLQEVITNTPNVAMVGVKPSNIYVTLGTSDQGWYLHVHTYVYMHMYMYMY